MWLFWWLRFWFSRCLLSNSWKLFLCILLGLILCGLEHFLSLLLCFPQIFLMLKVHFFLSSLVFFHLLKLLKSLCLITFLFFNSLNSFVKNTLISSLNKVYFMESYLHLWEQFMCFRGLNVNRKESKQHKCLLIWFHFILLL